MTLSPSDVSILTRVAQYGQVPINRRLQLLAKASPQAQEIGKAFLEQSDPTNPVKPEISAAAEAVTRWIKNNRRVGNLNHSVGTLKVQRRSKR